MTSRFNRRARQRNQRANRVKVEEFEYVLPHIDSSHIEDPLNLLHPFSLYPYQRDILA